MGLRNYKPRKTSVKVGDETVQLRGLSLTDLSLLVANHLKSADEFMDQFAKQQGDVFSDDATINMIRMLATDAPEISAYIIAMACGEAVDEEDLKNLADVVAEMPVAKQIEMLIIIANHTFEDAGGPKKLFMMLKGFQRTVLTEAMKGA